MFALLYDYHKQFEVCMFEIILTRNNHDQMTTVLKSDYSVHAIKQCKPPAISAEGLLYEDILLI